MTTSNEDKFYYMSIETSSKNEKRNPSQDEIITIQYQQLDGNGNPISELVILKAWESNEASILSQFLKIYNEYNIFEFTPIDNTLNYSLLTIGHRLVHYKLMQPIGICDYLFYKRPSMNLMPIFRILNNMSLKSGTKINEISRKNIPILYENKNYDEIIKIIEKKANVMINQFQLFVTRIQIIFSDEFNEYINNMENKED